MGIQSYDVVIVGGGPMGSIAGSLLAREGFNVLILEKQEHPRWKACGEAISLGGIQLFRQYNLYQPIEKLLHQITGISINVLDREIVNIATIRSDQPMEYTTDRAAFDRALFDYAASMGAETHDDEKMVDLSTSDDELLVKTFNGTYRTKTCIGADGAYSKVGKLLFRRWEAGELVGAKVARYRIPGNDGHFDPEVMEYYFVKGGYGWIFPRVEHESLILNMGIAGLGLNDNERRILFDNFIGKIQDERGLKLKEREIGQRIWSHMIPLQGPCRGTFTDRCLLVGDAGGFVNPLTGGGLHYGVHSTILAAETMAEYLENKIESLSHYEEKWLRDIKPAFDSSLKTRAMLTSMEPMDLVKLLQENPSMKEEIFGGFLGH